MLGLRSLAALVPPAVLVVVAGVQVHLSRTEHLAPWKGGGFGMFSTTDATANRTLRVYARQGARLFEVRIPASLEETVARARVLPSERLLQRLARSLAEWVPAQDFRFELWRQRFDAGTLAPRPILLRYVEIALAPDADR